MQAKNTTNPKNNTSGTNKPRKKDITIGSQQKAITTRKLPLPTPATIKEVIHISLQAGAAIMEVYQAVESDINITKKEDNSPLTNADRDSHKTIITNLKNITDYPILSEEGKHTPYEERKKWTTYWLIDPLDGTKEFIKRNGEFTVNIALIHNNAPIFGVVYVPAHNILYYGVYTQGAYHITAIPPDTPPHTIPAHELPHDLAHNPRHDLERDTASNTARQPPRDPRLTSPSTATGINQADQAGQTDQAGKTDQADKANQATGQSHHPITSKQNPLRIVASRSHLDEQTRRYIDGMKKYYKHVEIVSTGSSIKLCWIASGQAHIYPRFAPTMEWDTAAGDAVCRAAGALVYQKKTGVPLRYNKEDLKNPYFLAYRPEIVAATQ